ncbi:MAG: hypothetical protein C5S48_05680 [Candidatus Methanogaster sp.]|nr:MAG: hypothetical protein C5S48_05680 [ANME-2 cluster archaeon]
MSNIKNVILPTLLLSVILAVLFSLGCLNNSTPTNNQIDEQTGSMMWDGLERSYHLHTPLSYNKTEPIPLVIVLHGGGGSSEQVARATKGGFNTLSDKEGFIVVYPDGIEGHWNDGRKNIKDRAHRENIDDLGFISALIDKLIKESNVNPARVYATGMSNGAGMSYRLACELTGKIAAIAPVALPMPENLVSTCSPSEAISVLIIHGTDDPLAPWEGGDVARGRGKVISIEETVRYWVAHNNCSSSPEIIWESDKDSRDGTRVRREVYGEGRDETEVILYAIEGGGHAWPGGYQYWPERIVGKMNKDMDADEVIWNFFHSSQTQVSHSSSTHIITDFKS